jgi:isopropylmalate/homocitrate/citramalate synthase
MATESAARSSGRILIRDSTLREGLDVPRVEFSMEQRLRIARLLDQAKVPEIEVVAPGKIAEDLPFAGRLKEQGLRIRTSGLVYSFSPRCKEEVVELSGCLDRFDILMPVSEKRRPFDRGTKRRLLQEMLDFSLQHMSDVGVGFPHSTQADPEFLQEISQASAKNGARRIVIYDTNGSADPSQVYELIKRLTQAVDVPLFFHAHNDLGLATANSLAAVHAGADGLDTTVNGLGDRAGNASFEQVVMVLYLKGFSAGISLEDLKELSEVVAEASGVEIPGLAPILGEYIATHKSPGHLESPELFEAFDPSLVGLDRKIDK